MQQSGVLVVELTEARTLARELAVSEGGDSVRRPMPYYVLGRYKTTGHGAKRSVHPGFLGPEIRLVTACNRDICAFLCWNSEDCDRFECAWSARRGGITQRPVSLDETRRKPVIRRFRNAKTHPVFPG